MGLKRRDESTISRVALIDTGVADLSTYRNYARRNADLLGLQYEELQGSLSFFQKLLCGPWDKIFGHRKGSSLFSGNVLGTLRESANLSWGEVTIPLDESMNGQILRQAAEAVVQRDCKAERD